MAKPNGPIKDAGFTLFVDQLDQQAPCNANRTDLDADGRYVRYGTERWTGLSKSNHECIGEPLAVVGVPNGTAPAVAAAVLRRLADLVEQHGAELLNLPIGARGDFDAEGKPQEVECSISWSDYDDDGRLNLGERPKAKGDGSTGG